MAINKVIYGSNTLMDITDTTAVASDVATGKVFYTADGTQTTGSSSAIVPTGTLNITANDTYDVTNYASANVNVSGSSWTKIAETSYTVSTTNTSGELIATWETGHSELWTSSAFAWVHIRDTAGKRNGYFYGNDTVFLNRGINYVTNVGGRFRLYYQSNKYSAGVDGGTTGRGVYPLAIWNNGDIEIYACYSSTYSKTIDGTYSVEVYLLTPPFTILE